jgi:cathepsin X
MGSPAFTDANPVYQCFPIPADEPASVQCFGDQQCVSQPYPRLGIKDFGQIPYRDIDAMKREIAARGPIACALDATLMMDVDGKSIIEDEPEVAKLKAIPHSHLGLNSKNHTDHIVEVVGWGIDPETEVPYWEM